MVSAHSQEFVKTDAYKWQGDTITQGEFFATAPNEYEIVSTYSAQPGFRMPIQKMWKLKNDISSYPRLSTENLLQKAIYNMGLDEMVNAVEHRHYAEDGKGMGWSLDPRCQLFHTSVYGLSPTRGFQNFIAKEGGLYGQDHPGHRQRWCVAGLHRP